MHLANNNIFSPLQHCSQMYLKSNELDQAFTCNICDETKCHYSNAFTNIFTMQN